MIVLHIDHMKYERLLETLAGALNVPYAGEDFIALTPPAGKGIIKLLRLFDELQVMLIDTVYYQPMLTTRPASTLRYYVLHFDEVFITDGAKFIVDDDVLHKENILHAVVRLTSTLFMNAEEIPANMAIKSVKILFSESWLKNYMGLAGDTDVLKNYLALKTESFDIEPLDAGYKALLDELWLIRKDDPLQNIVLQNRVTLLMEKFFTSLYKKMSVVEGKLKLTDDEIERLIQVEQLLVKDFNRPPITIEALSKMASMSTTRLKNKFKNMFGNSIYAYYQQQRLKKAKELLATGNYSIKDVAETIGYQSTTNFTAAFKKQFNKMPSELL